MIISIDTMQMLVAPNRTHLYNAAETVLALTVLELRLHQATCIACADQELDLRAKFLGQMDLLPDGNDSSTVRIA